MAGWLVAAAGCWLAGCEEGDGWLHTRWMLQAGCQKRQPVTQTQTQNGWLIRARRPALVTQRCSWTPSQMLLIAFAAWSCTAVIAVNKRVNPAHERLPAKPDGYEPGTSSDLLVPHNADTKYHTYAAGDGLNVEPEHRQGATGFLGGARDLFHDEERNLVLVVGTGGSFSVLNVSNVRPWLVSTIAPAAIKDAHGLTYDRQRRRAFVASVATASVLSIDISDPQQPKILSILHNSTWLYYSTHISYDAVRSVLFVCSAGNGAEPSGKEAPPGHSISSVAVAEDGSMQLLHRMTSWAPDRGGIPGN